MEIWKRRSSGNWYAALSRMKSCSGTFVCMFLWKVHLCRVFSHSSYLGLTNNFPFFLSGILSRRICNFFKIIVDKYIQKIRNVRFCEVCFFGISFLNSHKCYIFTPTQIRIKIYYLSTINRITGIFHNGTQGKLTLIFSFLWLPGWSTFF